MAMTKRHFEKLARILRDAKSEADSYAPTGGGSVDEYATGRADAVSSMAQAIADMCSDENPRFDRNRFLDACRPTTPKE